MDANENRRRAKMNLDDFFGKLLSLISRHPPETLSYSKISRWTGVSRTTLYYYFGSSLEGMLKEAAAFGAKTFVQMTIVKDYKRFPNYGAFQNFIVSQSHLLMNERPWAASLYLRYRGDKSYFGDAIREVEAAYFKEQIAAWKHFHKTEPDEYRIRFVSYIKIGVLYGLTADPEIWFGEGKSARREKMSATVARLAESLLK